MLDKLNVGAKICSYLWCFLKERRLQIVTGNNTLFRYTNRGLAQGDPLSPLLFNVATVNICKVLNYENDIGVFQYADDFAVYIIHENIEHSVSKLQSALNLITTLLSNIGLESSPHKSKVCLFSKKRNVTISQHQT